MKILDFQCAQSVPYHQHDCEGCYYLTSVNLPARLIHSSYRGRDRDRSEEGDVGVWLDLYVHFSVSENYHIIVSRWCSGASAFSASPLHLIDTIANTSIGCVLGMYYLREKLHIFDVESFKYRTVDANNKLLTLKSLLEQERRGC